MKEPHIGPLAKTDTRRYWKGKRNSSSFTIALPKDWVLTYAEKESPGSCMLTQIGKTLLITTNKEQQEETKLLHLVMNRDNSNQIYYSVISAYLQNYSEVRITEGAYNANLIDKLSVIGDKLPGAQFYGKEASGNYIVKFETKIENIPNKLDEIYRNYLTMYATNKMMFSSSDDEYDVDTEHKIMKRMESQVDNKVFALKRLFTHVFNSLLQDPTILLDTGLVREKEKIDYSAAYKIAGYRSIANSIERITDIQKDIFEFLMKFPSEVKLKNSGYGFQQYYDGAHKMIDDAYQSKKIVENLPDAKDGFKCLLRVLAAENNEKDGTCYREGYISFDERKKISDIVGKYPKLGALEGLIWGCTGLATNIAETWINMSDLPKINEYVAEKREKRIKCS
jgi:hypothetical protein